MKYASAVVLGSAAAAMAQSSSLRPSTIAIPVFAGAQGSTVVTVTFTTPFGTVPAGYVTVFTQPIQPNGPVYSTGTGIINVPTSLVESTTSASERSSATPSARSSTKTTSESSRAAQTTTPQQSSAPAVTPSQQTGTNVAAGPMMTAVGVPAAVAVAAGWALL